jgi:WD40 repeat protein
MSEQTPQLAAVAGNAEEAPFKKRAVSASNPSSSPHERLKNLLLLIGVGWFQRRQRLTHLVTEFVVQKKDFVQIQLHPSGAFLTFNGRDKLEIHAQATGRDIYQAILQEKKGCIADVFVDVSLKRRLQRDDLIKPEMVLFAKMKDFTGWKRRPLRTDDEAEPDSDSDSDFCSDDYVQHLCYTQDGNILIAESNKVTLMTKTGRLLKAWRRLGEISCMCYSSDGSHRFAIGNHIGALKIIHEHTNQITCIPNQQFGNIDGHVASVNCIAFSSQGIVATGSDDWTIKLWHSVSGSHIATLGNPRNLPLNGDPDALIWWPMGEDDTHARDKLGHTNLVSAIDFTRDGKRLVSASKDKTIRLWSVKQHRLLHTIRIGMPISVCVWNPAGTLIAAGYSRTVKILTLHGNRHGTPLKTYHHLSTVIDIQWPTPDCIVSTCVKKVQIWSAMTGLSVSSIGHYAGEIFTARLSPGGDMLAIGTCCGVDLYW